MRKFTREEFINMANSIHGFRYNYDKVIYIDSHTPIIITCPIHGDFEQFPYAHLQNKGCKKCANENKKKLVCGVGINDYNIPIKHNGQHTQSYKIWRYMLIRCYSEKWAQRNPSYIGCSVCEEWKYFSNFKKWFDENYIEGYQLDKDILIKCNKVYSPETCCFIPQKINILLIKSDKTRGDTPIGVKKCTYRNVIKYISGISRFGKYEYLGTFDTAEKAFYVYKDAKEKHIQEVALKYYSQGKITERVYNALMNYKVEIND